MVPLKILLLCFDYADILVINMFLQTLLMVMIVVGLCRTEKQYFVLPFCVSVLSMMPITIALCLQYSDIFYISLIGSNMIIWRSKSIKNKGLYFLFLLIGMMTSYFDFLTYPFVSLGVPLVTALIYADDTKLIEEIGLVIKSSIAWCIGYSGMWAGKWVLGSVLCPESGSMAVAISSILYRGSNMAEGIMIDTFDVLLKNMFVYLRWPVILLIGITACFYVIRSIGYRTLRKENLSKYIPYIFVCLYPIAWYLITKNHSYEHSFMTYRELSISTLAGLGMLAQLSEEVRSR